MDLIEHNYPLWRDTKLQNVITDLNQYIVEIQDPIHLRTAEINKIKQLCNSNNFALIQIPKNNEYSDDVLAINTQLGLIDNDKHYFIHNDNLAHITKSNAKRQGEFIPYTDKKLNWHTDGYYNDEQHRIRSFSLFCANPAQQGGENRWLDVEMLYILLREKDPHLTQLLTLKDAMTIPAHIEDGKILRGESRGPIFFIDTHTQRLYMRYTQRKKNIAFNDEVLEAITFLDATLEETSAYHFEYKMSEGQGIINNNVIHTRNSFINDENNPRLMLRGRYFVRI
jgi:alpha-ketoglutarate-dependent taurine dioxygenase